HLADEEWNLLFRLFFLDGFLDPEQPVHFVGTQRHRQAPRADELDHALDAVDDVDRFLIEHHLHQDVARVDLALHRHLFAVLDLDHFLGRDQGLANRTLRLGARIFLDPPLHQRPHLVFVPRGDLNRVPAVLAHRNSDATPLTNTSCSRESINPITSPSTDTKITI